MSQWENEGMRTLESALAVLQGEKSLEISWLWDGGVDVKAGEVERNFERVSQVLTWLNENFRLPKGEIQPDSLGGELQKIYDSEIHLTIRLGKNGIFVALGTDFTGFEAQGRLKDASQILPWFQTAIHHHIPMSKYDAERRGEKWVPKWFGPEAFKPHNWNEQT